MMNRWGNDGHGPGGDPSWLGGGDRRGEDSQNADGWSSGFASDAQGPDSDFARSDSDFGGGRDPQAAEQMAPRFGDRAGEEPLPSEREGSSWTASFTGQDGEGSSSGRSTLSRVLGAIVPIITLVVFGIIALHIFGGGNGFGGFGVWWIFLFIIPVISRVVHAIRRHLGD